MPTFGIPPVKASQQVVVMECFAVIYVSTIVLAGVDDGVDPPVAEDELRKYFSHLRRATALRGIGHNVPQEAPTAFAEGIVELL